MVQPDAGASPRRLRRGPLSLNVFGIPFGLAGLAGTWTWAGQVGLAPRLVANILWVVVLVILLVCVLLFLERAGGLLGVRVAIDDPVFGPFAALVPAVGLMLGARLESAQKATGTTLVIASAVLGSAVGARFLAGLLTAPVPVASVHGGYLLPTTAAALVASQAFAVTGWDLAARAALGLGVFSWLVLGAVLLGRLATGPPLPVGLTPTLAVFSAPPAVLGNAMFAAGHETGSAQQFVLGTFLLLLCVQVALIPRYLRLNFSMAWWALTFTTAASATYAGQWLSGERPPYWHLYAWAVLLAATCVVGAVAVRTLTWLRTLLSHEAETNVTSTRAARLAHPPITRKG